MKDQKNVEKKQKVENKEKVKKEQKAVVQSQTNKKPSMPELYKKKI